MRTAALLVFPCLYKWYKHLYNHNNYYYVCIPIRLLTVEESGPEPLCGSEDEPAVEEEESGPKDESGGEDDPVTDESEGDCLAEESAARYGFSRTEFTACLRTLFVDVFFI